MMFSNIDGLHGNLLELAVATSRIDIVACAGTKVIRRRMWLRCVFQASLLPYFC